MDARLFCTALLLVWIALPGEAAAQARVWRFEPGRQANALGSPHGSEPALRGFAQPSGERSTGLERIISGWLMGTGAFFVAVLADPDPEWILLAAYGAGSAVGIGFATATREGIRPVPVAIGTAVGAIPWGIVVATMDTRRDLGGFPLVCLSYVAIPILGSVAHGRAAR